MTSAEEYAKLFERLVEEAEAQGLDVFIENDCCGCGNMSLRVIGSDGDSVVKGI